MKILFLLLAVTISMAFGCQQNAATENGSCNLSGRFYNRNILDKCPDIMPVDIPYYAVQLNFVVKDSVDIMNGIEKFRLPYSRDVDNCKFKISGATQFGDMMFHVMGDSILHLYDTVWTKITTYATFKKAQEANRNDWEFNTFLNECVIAGTYSMENKDKNPSRVIFLPNGQVMGLKPYLSYALCYAGDCLEETETPANIIEFTNDQGTPELFVYKMLDGQRHIQFFKVGDAIPDIKGGRVIGELAYEIKSENETE